MRIPNMRKSAFVLLLFVVASLQNLFAADWNPVADPNAVVVSGKVRFTVLTARMIRIEYSPTSTFEDRSTFAVVNRRLPVPRFTQRTEGNYLYIETDSLTLRYKIGSIPKMSDKSPNNLQIQFSMNGIPCTWYPGKDESLNLLGTNRTLDTAWGDNMRHKLEKGLLSRAGWSIIDESPATKRGDGSTSFPMVLNEDGFYWWESPISQSSTDWYFLGYGHDYMRCIQDFVCIGGKVPLPPKYIFGYWYSRYWAYTQSEFMQIIRDVEYNDIPMDVLIMDMDWHRSGWTGWSWNKSKIPTPRSLIRYMHSRGIRTALNLHPASGVSSSEDQYKALKADMGYDDSYTETIPWAIEDYSFAKPFFKNIIRPLEEDGVDFWWLDWQQHLLVDGSTLGETFWCNHTFFEDMEKNRPELRPVIYHRWGGLGSHRYPICFSGDTWASWSMLGYEIFFTSTASNVCYAYWGHDLGGHQGGNNDPELLLRWLQFGAYTPIFRTHATNDPKLERRIWKYSNFTQLREAVRMRYKLFPYLYTAARETYDTGIGMNRPLYYYYPEDNNAYVYEDEYMFGNDMLVAPIYAPAENGKSWRNIWLPNGNWWDVTEGKMRKGNNVIIAGYTLDEFPVFYREGAIIPFYPVQRTTVTTPRQIDLVVVPGTTGSGRLYEDDGANNSYTSGECANTIFTQTRTGSGINLVIGARQGTYEGIPTERTWNIAFLGMESPIEAGEITVNGKILTEEEVSWSESSSTLYVTIDASDYSSGLDQPLSINLPLVSTARNEDNGGYSIDYDDDSRTVSVTMPKSSEVTTLTVSTLSGISVFKKKGSDVTNLSACIYGLNSGTYICKAVTGSKVVTRIIHKRKR